MLTSSERLRHVQKWRLNKAKAYLRLNGTPIVNYMDVTEAVESFRHTSRDASAIRRKAESIRCSRRVTLSSLVRPRQRMKLALVP